MLSTKSSALIRKIIAMNAAKAAVDRALFGATFFKNKLAEKGIILTREQKTFYLHKSLNDVYFLIDDELLKEIKEQFEQLWKLVSAE